MITDEMLKKAVPQITSAMVDKMILLKMAEGQGIKPGPELVAKDFDKMMKTLDPKMLDTFKNQLKTQGKTLESYKAEVCQNKIAQDSLATDQWIEQNVLAKVKVSDNEVQKYYNDNKNMFKRPESVTASHILIKPEADTPEAKKAAKDKAEKLLASLIKGTADFEKVAEQESACPSGKAAKGSLGEFGKGQMIKEFEDAAFSMKPGELSKNVVETKFGYHIIKVTDKKAGSTIAFEKVKNYIKGQLVNMKAKEELKKILDQEKTRLKVKINV
jgi:peptidyl-prolyl cis-trans isomerase C